VLKNSIPTGLNITLGRVVIITGMDMGEIKSKPSTKEYRSNFDRIFRKKKREKGK
jgi:hypothetical protein